MGSPVRARVLFPGFGSLRAVSAEAENDADDGLPDSPPKETALRPLTETKP